MRYLYVAIGLLISTALSAETLTWDTPTTRVDGQPLAFEEISHYELQCGDSSIEIPKSSPDGVYEIIKADTLPGYGIFKCTLTTVDTGGLRSEPSNAVEIVWLVANPSSPTISITVKE